MTPSLVSACLSVSSLFPPSSVNILAFLGLVYCWLQSTKKLSENCQFFFCIRLSRLRILLLLSTNEPVVVNSYYLYDAKQQLFLMAMYQIVCAPFMKGHGLYMNKTSLSLSLSLSLTLEPACLALSWSPCILSTGQFPYLSPDHLALIPSVGHRIWSSGWWVGSVITEWELRFCLVPPAHIPHTLLDFFRVDMVHIYFCVLLQASSLVLFPVSLSKNNNNKLLIYFSSSAFAFSPQRMSNYFCWWNSILSHLSSSSSNRSLLCCTFHWTPLLVQVLVFVFRASTSVRLAVKCVDMPA